MQGTLLPYLRWRMGAALWAPAAATASSSPVRPAAPSVCPRHALLDSSTAGWGPAAPGRGVPASACRRAPTSIGSPSGVPARHPQSTLLWCFIATLSYAKSIASPACGRAAKYRQADIVMDAISCVAAPCSRMSPVLCTLAAPNFFSTAPTTASQHII